MLAGLMLDVNEPVHMVALLTVSAALCTLLIRLFHPWLVRYALARPNARSSHVTPTPQGGGIAVVAVVVLVMAACAALGLAGYREPWAGAVILSLTALAVVGVVDDIRSLPVLPRLVLQAAAALLLVVMLPGAGRIAPFLPVLVERGLLVIGLVWFINLTNFMDGIDWMMVVEVAPIAACLAALGLAGLVPELAVLAPLSLALLGGMIGFAPFNRHVARLFLGDVGSLPIGALVGWLLIVLATAGHIYAALILPMYFLADASITLVRRLVNGENIAVAHRSHFYQRAVTGGLGVPRVTGEVFVLNLGLAALAIVSVSMQSHTTRLACLLAALLATVVLLRRFERGGR